MSVIGEAILSAIIGEVVTVGLARLVDRCKGGERTKSKLQDLQRQLPQIKAVVEAAESGFLEAQTHGLQEWLWMLEDALYEAEDVLDELKYLELEKQVMADNTAEQATAKEHQGYHSPLGVRAFMKKSVSRMKTAVSGTDQMAKKLREVVNNLDQIATSQNLTLFHSLASRALEKQQQAEDKAVNVSSVTTATPTKEVLGRDEKKEEIIQWLMQPGDDLQLLSVVGHGGMGKTTLAKYVLEDERVKASFGSVMWAYVSQNFDAARITREILESATGKRAEVDTLGGLHRALENLLRPSDKKFLLVLDDAWDDENRGLWENLLAPLKFASKGGRILLTTRSKNVALLAKQALPTALPTELAPTKSINLGGLAVKEYLELFNRHAFFDRDKDSYPRLQSIGEQIAGKLGGSPLLAKVVGGMLNKNFGDAEYWNSISNRSIPGDVMSNLKLSYQYLSPHLRPCFAYCSILRQYSGFQVDDLVYLWMAVGLIQKDSSVESMENKGRRYFNDLLKQSFFEPDGLNGYKMHDLLYELAELVSQDECFTFTDGKQVADVPNKIRHLHINTSTPDIISKVEKWGSLRTLLLSCPGSVWEHRHAELLSNILRSCRSLRVLNLNIPGMESRPDTIGGLKHLRYLKLWQKGGQPLPLSKLYNLQTLELRGKSTQADISYLISLRHVIPVSFFSNLSGIGKLACLQELEFRVRQETGLKIGELNGLKQLRELSIDGLENVISNEEAREALIDEKKHMKNLCLSWSSRVQEHGLTLHEEVLEGLKPDSSLETLDIKNYMGLKLPGWMESLNQIESLKLESCSRLAQVPLLGEFNCLTNLSLISLSKVKVIGPREGFQQLRVLKIKGLEQLEKWCEEPGPLEETSSWFPRLQDLYIRDCPKLMMLPSLPMALRKLHLESVGLTALPKLWLSISCSGGSSSSSFPSSSLLTEVWIDGCPNLMSLANSFLQQQYHLGALRKLYIFDCEELMYLPVGGFGQLCSLQEMMFMDCPKLQVPQLETALQETTSSSSATTADVCCCWFLPASLWKLEIYNCGEMDRSLPTILKGAVSLSKLILDNCNSMTSLPPADVMATLTSLKSLSLWSWEKLTSLGGLNALPHPLDRLWIAGCPKLVVAAGAPVPPFNCNNIQKEDGVNSRSGFAVRQLIIDDPGRLLLVEPLRNLTSVQYLIIRDCSSVQYLDKEVEAWLLQNSTSLAFLVLHKASSLLALPACIESLTLLKNLHVGGCNEVLMKRLQDGGADWPHIKHIPHVFTDDD